MSQVVRGNPTLQPNASFTENSGRNWRLSTSISAEWTCGEGLDVHYHYVLVLLVKDGSLDQVPKWRDVLLSSKGEKKDPDWRRDNLRQYIMFVSAKELLTPLSQD
jgi:hypothetical protein